MSHTGSVCLTQLLEHLPHLFACLQHPYTAVRHMTARCVGVLSKIATLETMNSFLERVLHWLAAINDRTKQEGAIEALACILLVNMSGLNFSQSKMETLSQPHVSSINGLKSIWRFLCFFLAQRLKLSALLTENNINAEFLSF